MVAAIAVCVLAVIMSSELPYSAYISNFANLESFAKLFQRKFWHFEVEPRWWRKRWLYLSTSRRWMETIQEPTYLIHKEHSQKKYPRLQYPQQTRKLQLYFSHQLAAWRRSGLLVNVVTMDHCFNLEGRHCFSNFSPLAAGRRTCKISQWLLLVPRVCARRKLNNSGHGILSSAFVKLFEWNFKKQLFTKI